MAIIQKVLNQIYSGSINRIITLLVIVTGIALFIFSLITSLLYIQYDTLPHVESLPSVVIVSYVESIISIVSSLLQIVHKSYGTTSSVPLRYFILFVLSLVSMTHIILLMVSIHHFNRISDASLHLPAIETKYSCCGWYSISTLACKSLAGIRADRTCSSTVGVSFGRTLPTAMFFNICLFILSIFDIILSTIHHCSLSPSKRAMDDEYENPSDIINVSLYSQENTESITDNDNLILNSRQYTTTPTIVDVARDENLRSSSIDTTEYISDNEYNID